MQPSSIVSFLWWDYPTFLACDLLFDLCRLHSFGGPRTEWRHQAAIVDIVVFSAELGSKDAWRTNHQMTLEDKFIWAMCTFPMACWIDNTSKTQSHTFLQIICGHKKILASLSNAIPSKSNFTKWVVSLWASPARATKYFFHSKYECV